MNPSTEQVKRKSTKKSKFKMLRFRKNDPTHNVHAAIQHWIHSKGGTAVLTAGPEVQYWGDGSSKYRVALQIIGIPPQKKEEAAK